MLVERVGHPVESLEDANEEARFNGDDGRRMIFISSSNLLECAYERRVGTSQRRATEEFM